MTFWQKVLVALGLQEKPRRSQLTMWTYDENSDAVVNNRKLKKLLQLDDIWHQYYTDSMGRKVHNEWHWWGPDDGWHLHNWTITKDFDNVVDV